MTTDLAPTTLAALPTADLRRELETALGITARAIERVAHIWQELTRRGEDLTGIKFALRDYMQAVASGNLLPETVAHLAGQVRTLNAVATLSISEQRRLIAGEPVEVVNGNGELEQRPLDKLTWPEVARVIRDGAIRTPAEQRLALQRIQSDTAARKRVKMGRPPRVIVNAESGMMQVGATHVPLDRILTTLRAAGYDLKERS